MAAQRLCRRCALGRVAAARAANPGRAFAWRQHCTEAGGRGRLSRHDPARTIANRGFQSCGPKDAGQLSWADVPRSHQGRFASSASSLSFFLSFFLSDDLPRIERERIAARCDGLSSHKAANDAFYFDCPKPTALGIPVLVASGEKDWSIPKYKNEKLARRYNGDHISVPTAHDIMCDTHWERAAGQIQDWLFAKFGG